MVRGCVTLMMEERDCWFALIGFWGGVYGRVVLELQTGHWGDVYEYMGGRKGEFGVFCGFDW